MNRNRIEHRECLRYRISDRFGYYRTKIDGTIRTMPCTLRTEAMPQRVVTEEFQTTKLYKPETLSVWCLDKSEWRAFKVANVQEIKVIG